MVSLSDRRIMLRGKRKKREIAVTGSCWLINVPLLPGFNNNYTPLSFWLGRVFFYPGVITASTGGDPWMKGRKKERTKRGGKEKGAKSGKRKRKKKKMNGRREEKVGQVCPV